MANDTMTEITSGETGITRTIGTVGLRSPGSCAGVPSSVNPPPIATDGS